METSQFYGMNENLQLFDKNYRKISKQGRASAKVLQKLFRTLSEAIRVEKHFVKKHLRENYLFDKISKEQFLRFFFDQHNQPEISNELLHFLFNEYRAEFVEALKHSNRSHQ
jgi:hypothetical protein